MKMTCCYHQNIKTFFIRFESLGKELRFDTVVQLKMHIYMYKHTLSISSLEFPSYFLSITFMNSCALLLHFTFTLHFQRASFCRFPQSSD